MKISVFLQSITNFNDLRKHYSSALDEITVKFLFTIYLRLQLSNLVLKFLGYCNIFLLTMFTSLLVLILLREEKRKYRRLTLRYLRDAKKAFQLPEIEFKQIFTMDKQSVLKLITIIKNYVPKTYIPIHTKVLITLNFLGTGNFRLSEWSSMRTSTVKRIVREMCCTISDNLLKEWVTFPCSFNTKVESKVQFFYRTGARGILGAIDCMHVNVVAPPKYDERHPPEEYYKNKFGEHSINVMITSDATSKIISCNARYPGSVTDADIWETSNIRKFLQREFENGDRMSRLMGDNDFPLEPWLFTPFLNVRPESPEAHYNDQVKRVRKAVRKTIATLRGRFKCLSKQKILMYSHRYASKIIYTCCVLHNMAIQGNRSFPDHKLAYDKEEELVYSSPVIDEEIAEQALTYRNNYIQMDF